MENNQDTKPNDFEFIFDNKPDIEEGQLTNIEVTQVLKGDLEPIQTYLDDYAYKNLDYKMPADPRIGKLIKLQQLGV